MSELQRTAANDQLIDLLKSAPSQQEVLTPEIIPLKDIATPTLKHQAELIIVLNAAAEQAGC